MSYLVLARKWRPKQLDEVVGQAHVTRTLANAIEMDRVAHAFVFSGVRGVGKTSLARILAKSLNCDKGPTPNPCGECESCKAVVTGTAVDVIEIDGASNNSVDDVRQLRETVPYRPVLGRFKIYVIDEVHMLSTSAFNALLKTLEEPPPHVKFVFATTEPHKIPVTVLSRCQRYDFRRIPTDAIVSRIEHILQSEGIKADATALHFIGREADGSMRDALSILDQVLAASSAEITADMVSDLLGMAGRRVYMDLSQAIVDGNARRCLEIVREIDAQGFDLPVFAKGVLEHLRNLVVVGVCNGDPSLVQVAAEEAAELSAQAKSVSVETLHRAFKHFSESYEVIARSSHPRIMLEMALARIADLGEIVPAAELVGKLETLMRQGPSAPPQGAPSKGGGAGPFPRAGGDKQPSPPSVQPRPVAGGEPKPLPVGTAWEKLVGELRGSRPQIASMLECAVPTADERSGSLHLIFSPDAEAAANIAAMPTKLREIADVIGERCNRPVSVDVRVEKTTGVPVLAKRRMMAEEKQRQLEEDARRHPVVLKAVAEFGE